jgi:hypothetical protein
MFKKGDIVISERFGIGEVSSVTSSKSHPLLVKFETRTETYTKDGFFTHIPDSPRNIKPFSNGKPLIEIL